MSVVKPREYYKCDYCKKTSYNPKDFKYTDNSGLNNKCYDICSDKCMENHKIFLKLLYKIKSDNLNFDFSGTVEEHIKDFVWTNF